MKYSLWNFIMSKTHILPSPMANKLGVQLIRIILTNFLILLRRFKNCRPRTNYEKKLINEGIVVIPNFLPENEFLELKKEINEVISKSNENKISEHGSTKTFRHDFKTEDFRSFPSIQRFAKNEKLIRLISVAEGSKVFNEIRSFGFETSMFEDPKTDNDNNVFFHSDVHFHSHKILFYTSDVTEENAPFAYCINSHKNNIKRLFFEFKRGLLNDSHDEKWRIQNNLHIKFFKNYFNYLMKLKYKVIGKQNTLIIANVHGFHQRGVGLKGSARSLIRIPFRYNPFKNHKSYSAKDYSGSIF